jgi:hypothetical protein
MYLMIIVVGIGGLLLSIFLAVVMLLLRHKHIPIAARAACYSGMILGLALAIYCWWIRH